VTGTIVELEPTTRSGVIRSEDGSRVVFHGPAIGGEFNTLSVGGRVRFDYDRTWSEVTAVHVLVETVLPDAPLDLRYMGFDQAKDVRRYRFDAILGGKLKRRFVVVADMALFRKHHIAVQDGPTLCLHKLMSGLETAPESSRYELGNDDLLAHAEAQATAASRKPRPKGLTGRPRNGAASHSPWGRPPESR